MSDSLTSHLRRVSQQLLEQVVSRLDRLGIKPNTLTVIGLLGHILVAWLIARGNLMSGAFVLIVFGLLDTLDGALARYTHNETSFGAFLDSVCDRFSEALIFIGIFFYFIPRAAPANYLLVVISVILSMSVSYIRARAESLGAIPRNGILTRLERYMVIVISLMLDRIEAGLWVISILSLVTISQRIWLVFRQLADKKN